MPPKPKPQVSPRERSLNGLSFRCLVLSACAVALFLIGGIGVNVIHNVSSWTIVTFYQLHTACFLVDVPIKWMRVILCITFVCLIAGAFALGNFITESEVFGNCTKNDNITGVKIEEVGRLKDITSLAILFTILTFFEIRKVWKERDSQNELLFAKNTYKKTGAIYKVLAQAVCFGVYGLVFIIIFGLAIGFVNAEPDWDKSSWQQLYYGVIVAGLTVFAISVALLLVYRVVRKSEQNDVKGSIIRLKMLLWVGVICLILCAVFLGSFAKETGVLTKCRWDASAKKGLVITSEKYRNTLKGLSVACIVVFVISFIMIGYECGDRNIRNEELVCVKVEASPPMTQSGNETGNKNPKQQEQPKNGNKTANKNHKQQEQSKDGNKTVNKNPKQQKQPKDGNKTVNKNPKQQKQPKDGNKTVNKNAKQQEQSKDGNKTVNKSSKQPEQPTGANSTTKSVHNKEESDSPKPEFVNYKDSPKVVRVGIGNQAKQKDDHIQLLRIQNEHLQEQNMLLRQEIQHRREFQQPLASANLLSQVYGQGTSSDTMIHSRQVITFNEQLSPIHQYAFVTTVPIVAPPSYNDTMSEHTSTEQPATTELHQSSS